MLADEGASVPKCSWPSRAWSFSSLSRRSQSSVILSVSLSVEIGREDDAPGEFAVMGLVENLFNLAHGPCFHKGFKLNATVQAHLQNRRILVGRAAPGADDFGIEGHELGEHVTRLLGTIADDHQRPDEGKQ